MPLPLSMIARRLRWQQVRVSPTSISNCSPHKTVAEFVAAAKARPGELSFGSPGHGAVPHLSAELFTRAAGIKMTHVPYRGAPQAVTDLLGVRDDGRWAATSAGLIAPRQNGKGSVLEALELAWLFLCITSILVLLESFENPLMAASIAYFRLFEVGVGVLSAIIVANLLQDWHREPPPTAPGWRHLFGAPGLELSLIEHNLGELALVGFFANGEIANGQLHGYTGVLTVFV